MTDERTKQIVAAYREGDTMMTISVRHKISMPKVRSMLVEARVNIRGKGGKVSPFVKRAKLMVEMRSGGATLQQIGDEFNLSRERVRQILRAAG